MTQFSRRARWLNFIFPQSVSPAQVDPATRSDDVSLVQQYDGGALGFNKPSFPDDPSVLGEPLIITEPEVAIREFLTVVGITTITDMVQMPTGLYARVFAASHKLVAGTKPALTFMELGAPTDSGVSEHRVMFTNGHTNVGNTRKAFRLVTDIIPPGMQLDVINLTGAADTQYRVSLAWVVAPVGAIIISTKGNGDETA